MSIAITKDDSIQLLGKAQLIGRVQQMVAESGDPEGFDVAAWVAQWLETPLPALGGETPEKFMGTAGGQAIVTTILARMQWGVLLLIAILATCQPQTSRQVDNEAYDGVY